MKPLIATDPVRVEGHRILGRLGEGGQGVVYLGEAADGRRVAIKMLGAGLDDPDARVRFRQEIEYARRVKAFCTAQVLASGEAGGTPYVVSEFVDGPSLAQVIAERGALRGAELRRLAIGTLTALAAIHQAGVVHRDFKPGNVLLSRDGPRVIDFGISRALEEAEPGGDHLVGTPPYMAPEQFGGQQAGPRADMFAWAATMVAAANGSPPFGTGDVPALINRIMTAEPVLGELDGELRELAVRCLAKDPRERPTAPRALLTLLGHRVPEGALRGTGEHRLLAEGQQSAAPPAKEPGAAVARRRWPLVAGTAGLAVAVTAAVLLLRPSPAPPAPVAAPTPPPAPPPAPRPGPLPLTSTSETRLPDTRITLHENPADPVWVSSYHDHRKSGTFPSYVRDATGRFAFFGNLEEPIVSPGGGYVASLSATRFQRTGFETVRIREPATGRDREVRTVDKPVTLWEPVWSPDGRRLVATAMDVGGQERAVGFTVVDPAAGTARTVKVAGAESARYAWGADGASLVHGAAGGAVRVVDLDGRPLRTFRGVGQLAPGGVERTELGTVFSTKCPDDTRNVCFWDGQSGTRKGMARLPAGGDFRGWLDEGHFLATVPDGRDTDVVLMGLDGKAVRTLATGPRAEIDEISLWFTRR
ncbi:protein kinase domain-containing protein [Nonomuraea jiangxiensis]|uniref:Serine/threonine protein kinase n=1 Tax=Nonomuraea jiangxiensis TaxID=633440 RepID=A0A1G7Y6T6_9ACTN|nr:protein kinase [Nonomuraea jiangxiensis]SDG92158.1 Serine/threonine protein kinase [Nonomuraea jiangxiensis]